MSWLRHLWDSIATILGAIGHFIGDFFTHADEVVDDINHMRETYIATKLNIEREIQQIRDFKFDPKWKNRVINVPAAIDQLQLLKETLFGDFRDRLETLQEPIHQLTLILHQEAAPDAGDPTHAISALSRTSVKLNHIVTMVHQLRDAFDVVCDFVDIFRQLREELSSLDAIFLQQGNLRHWTTDHLRRRVKR